MNICLYLATQPWDIESALIRFGTLCDWSHAGWYDRDTNLTFSAMADGKGLAWRPVRKNQKILLIDAPGAAESLQLALQYEGAPYDYLTIIGMLLHRNWNRPGSFICDVAVFHFQELAGYPLVNPAFIPRIHLTPRDILLSPLVRQAT
jgi:hypothetical protein